MTFFEFVILILAHVLLSYIFYVVGKKYGWFDE